MKRIKSKKINIVTLGCSKNLVDSEEISTFLKKNNYQVIFDSGETQAKVVIINTCGFIADAKQESINTILEFVEAKKRGEVEQVYVIGCLVERYKKELQDEIPDIDKYFGVNDLQQILKALDIDYKKDLTGERNISTPNHYAYLKISEGCSRKCAFCAIPIIRGKHISVPMEEIELQAKSLAKSGVKEINLIAQDISYYGLDLYKETKLPELLKRLREIHEIEWFRLHYAYPANFPEEALHIIQESKNICKYLDIPFQHATDNMLKTMLRGHTQDFSEKLLEKIKQIIPDISLRTTLLVGHPKESKDDFRQLVEFVKRWKFDRLGVFKYSEEDDTYSANNYKDSISNKVKEERANEIMAIQQEISLEKNRAKVGNVYKIIIDRHEGEYYVGRTEFDSPEIDNEVLVKDTTKGIKIGNFYTVKITGAQEFDLNAEII